MGRSTCRSCVQYYTIKCRGRKERTPSASDETSIQQLPRKRRRRRGVHAPPRRPARAHVLGRQRAGDAAAAPLHGSIHFNYLCPPHAGRRVARRRGGVVSSRPVAPEGRRREEGWLDVGGARTGNGGERRAHPLALLRAGLLRAAGSLRAAVCVARGMRLHPAVDRSGRQLQGAGERGGPRSRPALRLRQDARLPRPSAPAHRRGRGGERQDAARCAAAYLGARQGARTPARGPVHAGAHPGQTTH